MFSIIFLEMILVSSSCKRNFGPLGLWKLNVLLATGQIKVIILFLKITMFSEICISGHKSFKLLTVEKKNVLLT